jgi:hypothetical protein
MILGLRIIVLTSSEDLKKLITKAEREGIL